MDMMTLLIQAGVNGLVIGTMYALMAIGFTLVFGIMRVVNFAHGEFYMIGSFIAFFTYAQWQLPFVVTILAAVLLVGVVGALVEWALIRPLRGDELTGMIATLGISVVIQNTALMYFGASPRPMPDVISGLVRVGPAVFSWSRIFVIIAAALVIGAFWLFMQKSRTGRAMRAVAQDREAALIQGIDVEKIFPLAFGISVALAAVAGAMMAPVFSVSPFVGVTPMLKAFIVVILGGLGSIPGAVLGGLLLGMIESFGATLLGAMVADMLQLALVIAILLVRPSGLMGRKEA
ncbi:branched-chain amino acid ABC transporter permease [Roseovarius sp.]|jgi:branched-chain amino acid transport system permease protein|uniref:branched-chain amino acid ABC transporter permease n=1 Tax=Roseovarius sp. TaxID=1486281 RepID=UPI00263918C5|nr:branched-chain amino acid ABC transporter permease [Roseovarius sp.]MDM8167884.1 branched-chain amino acid ABC transporter permease [Roseovarius sp.]